VFAVRFRFMAMYRIQYILHTLDGTPNNFVTNTFHVLAVDDADALAASIDIRGGYSTIVSYLSSLLTQNGHEFKIYNLEDPEPRAPTDEGSWNLSSAPAGSNLPPEVALCMSFQAEKISGVPQARRRNRVYLGPFDVSACGTDGRPAPALVTLVADWGEAIFTAAGLGTWDWAIYSTFSPTTGVIAANGWVDNEFDTQRRRGRESTSRTTFV
jgi:hypothetical protein